MRSKTTQNSFEFSSDEHPMAQKWDRAYTEPTLTHSHKHAHSIVFKVKDNAAGELSLNLMDMCFVVCTTSSLLGVDIFKNHEKCVR